ncbi:PAS domain-containing protein [Haloarchaeobius amylolyticus]|uniref:PAS domain-containing protein n=1 Tax=Haloarchaeobius amylolyticus TaxID=1198296 RepID=UPI00226D463E|nr:PAS domain-containing protein [Haloarchaeobius amylolyticus]
MDADERRRDPERIERFLELVLDTGEMNGAFVDTDLRHTWVHNSGPEPAPEEVIGKSDAELFSEEVAAPTMDIKREAMETESRVEREFTLVEPWGQHRYRAAAEPLYDESGAAEGAMFTAIDLSERYQFLERTTDAVFTVDSDWEITFWDERITERTGVDPETVVGRNLWDAFGDSIPDELATRYRETMDTGEPARLEQYLPEPYDYWVEIRVFADDDGLSVYSRDITDRVEHEQRIERQRDTLDLLNQVLRHDIRNDLQLVLAYAESIVDDLDEEHREYVEAICDSADHAVDLTTTAREISDVLLADVGETEQVNLRPVLEREVGAVRAGNPGAAIAVETPVADVTVPANDLVNSVFRNLLKNAVIHNDKEVADVTVSTAVHDDEVVVRVADNGPGIPDDHKETVFGKGERGLGSPGTGIGLYLVRTLVESYDGRVTVADNDPEGAVFSVWLPLAEEA